MPCKGYITATHCINQIISRVNATLPATGKKLEKLAAVKRHEKENIRESNISLLEASSCEMIWAKNKMQRETHINLRNFITSFVYHLKMPEKYSVVRD